MGGIRIITNGLCIHVRACTDISINPDPDHCMGLLLRLVQHSCNYVQCAVHGQCDKLGVSNITIFQVICG